MCRPSSLVFVALCIFSVYGKPAVPENAQLADPSAMIGDPKFMTAFLEFLQNHLSGGDPAPAPVEPTVTITPIPDYVPEPQPTVTVIPNIVPNYPQVNSSVQQWGNVRIVTHPRINIDTPELLTPEQQKKQAMNAKYRFSTYMDDNIKGSFLARAEQRDGLKVTGQYGYDDGFINKMVYYVADDQGYRIVKDVTKPSTKTGKLDGTARVQIIQDNTQVDYNIASKEVSTPTRIIA